MENSNNQIITSFLLFKLNEINELNANIIDHKHSKEKRLELIKSTLDKIDNKITVCSNEYKTKITPNQTKIDNIRQTLIKKDNSLLQEEEIGRSKAKLSEYRTEISKLSSLIERKLKELS